MSDTIKDGLAQMDSDDKRLEAAMNDKSLPNEIGNYGSSSPSWNELMMENAELQSQLTQEKSKLTHVLTSAEEGSLPWWQKKHDELLASIVRIGDMCDRVSKELTAAHKERDESVAACAVMRNSVNMALAQLRENFSGAGLKSYMNTQFPATEGHAPFTGFCSDVDAVFKTLFDCQLSTSAGTALLARLKEAEWLLDNVIEHAAFIADASDGSWMNRRDKWMKEGAK